ncbi:Transcriptional regulator, ArsR family [Candidatus Sulfopaludibacter sp. SbA3]|nr:Transcriptional regulator, ArsR family [Candidatus Sulfopaludibacter sp. SbA3]
MPLAVQGQFVYYRSMDVMCGGQPCEVETAVSGIAAAIGEPARARMLYCLMDGHARTSTELAMVAEVTPSTASAHLNRLKAGRLVQVFVQGKHRYYSLEGPNVARALEGLSVLAGVAPGRFVPGTPSRLRAARTCYDHMAGTLGVRLHDRLQALGWLSESYDVTAQGSPALEALGIGIAATRALRRRFAYGCLDWSERRPHVGGALGAALLQIALKRRWVIQDLDSRALSVTALGRREMSTRFGVSF